MASSSGDQGSNLPDAKGKEAPMADLANKWGTLSEKYDLDKNPIKFRQSDGSLSTEAHDKNYMELTLRSGRHSDLVRKLLRQRIESRAAEFPRWPSDDKGGVRTIWAESRYWYDRERLCDHFDDDWRKYRAKYLTSLELDPSEPIRNPEYERALLNPIRRFYMKPGDWFEKHITSKYITNHRETSLNIRSITAKSVGLVLFLIAMYYKTRYGERQWDTGLGPLVTYMKPKTSPYTPGWGKPDPFTEDWHFSDQGFLSRTCYKDLRDYDDYRTQTL